MSNENKPKVIMVSSGAISLTAITEKLQDNEIIVVDSSAEAEKFIEHCRQGAIERLKQETELLSAPIIEFEDSAPRGKRNSKRKNQSNFFADKMRRLKY